MYRRKNVRTKKRKHQGTCRASLVIIIVTLLMAFLPSASLADENEKQSSPTIEKTVMDEDPSHGAWAKEADGSLGETLSFRLEGTLPGNLGDMRGCRYRFVDAIPDGIKVVPSSHKVMLVRSDGTEVNLGRHFRTSYDEDAGTVSVSCDDILAIGIDISSEDKIVVIYDFSIGEEIGLGLAMGNQSFAHIEWAELDDAGHGTEHRTVDDGAVVYAYGLRISKVAEESGESLAGASFRIGTADGRWMSESGWTDSQEAATEITTDEDGKAMIAPIDRGEYVIVETKAPSGYGKDQDIPIQIDATFGDRQRILTAESPTAGAIGSVDSGTGIIACLIRNHLLHTEESTAPGSDEPRTEPGYQETPAPATRPTSTPTGDSKVPDSPDTPAKIMRTISGTLLQTGSGMIDLRLLIAIAMAGLAAVAWLRRRNSQ